MHKEHIELNKYIYKITENQLHEYYINDTYLYKFCDYKSIDNRRFGYFINESDNGLYLIREINLNYFLISRLDKDYNHNNIKTYYIFPYCKEDRVIFWISKNDKLLNWGIYDTISKYFNNWHILDLKYNSELIMFIDDNNHHIDYENINFNKVTLGELFFLYRKPYELDIKRNLIYDEKNFNNKNNYVFLNSYEEDDNGFIDTIKFNLEQLNFYKSVDFYNTRNMNHHINDFNKDYDSIVYFGHGYSGNDYLQIKMNNISDLCINNKSKNINDKKDFTFLACNDSILSNKKSEYNSIKSMLDSGYSQILMTKSKVEKDIIKNTYPYLLTLSLILNSMEAALTLLRRLSRSVLSLEIPYRLYKL